MSPHQGVARLLDQHFAKQPGCLFVTPGLLGGHTQVGPGHGRHLLQAVQTPPGLIGPVQLQVQIAQRLHQFRLGGFDPLGDQPILESLLQTALFPVDETPQKTGLEVVGIGAEKLAVTDDGVLPSPQALLGQPQVEVHVDGIRMQFQDLLPAADRIFVPARTVGCLGPLVPHPVVGGCQPGGLLQRSQSLVGPPGFQQDAPLEPPAPGVGGLQTDQLVTVSERLVPAGLTAEEHRQIEVRRRKIWSRRQSFLQVFQVQGRTFFGGSDELVGLVEPLQRFRGRLGDSLSRRLRHHTQQQQNQEHGGSSHQAGKTAPHLDRLRGERPCSRLTSEAAGLGVATLPSSTISRAEISRP